MEHGRVKHTALSRVDYDCLHTLHYTTMVLFFARSNPQPQPRVFALLTTRPNNQIVFILDILPPHIIPNQI